MSAEQQPAMRERYRRAEAMLHRNVKSLVFNLETQVRWLPDSTAFWYRSESASGHRFMLVDAQTGHQREAFDHRMVARALSVVVEREVEPERLPFEPSSTWPVAPGLVSPWMTAGGNAGRTAPRCGNGPSREKPGGGTCRPPGDTG